MSPVNIPQAKKIEKIQRVIAKYMQSNSVLNSKYILINTLMHNRHLVTIYYTLIFDKQPTINEVDAAHQIIDQHTSKIRHAISQEAKVKQTPHLNFIFTPNPY